MGRRSDVRVRCTASTAQRCDASGAATGYAIWSAVVAGVLFALIALFYVGIFMLAMGASVSGAVTGP